jgi:N-acetyl-anhydromuramyl-L-alanine amidase AmpD
LPVPETPPAAPPPPEVAEPAPAAGRVLLAGEDVAVDAEVTGPKDAGGFDGTLERCAFAPERVLPSSPAPGCDEPRRYGVRATDEMAPDAAARVAATGWDREALAARIDQVVLHYDAAGTSRRCFEVMHDVRGLSCHFLLDVDGRLYQSLDLVHRARQATIANERSIGIEIAHVGAFPQEASFAPIYRTGDHGLELVLPESLHPPPGAPFAPARPGFLRGRVNGQDLVQPDFTEAQYRTLERLLPELRRLFPRIEAAVPRDASGAVPQDALDAATLSNFRGVLGHFHVQKEKVDPGPAMDWERLARALAASGS